MRKRYFQWLDGELRGNVAILKSISEIDGETFYNFEDGESCNLRFISQMTSNPVELKNKFMVEISNPQNIWSFEEIKPRTWKDESTGEIDEIPTLHDFISSTAGGGSQTGVVESSDIGKIKLIPPKFNVNPVPLPNKEEYPEFIPKPEVKKQIQKETPKLAPQEQENDLDDKSIIVEKKIDYKPKEEPKRANNPVAILVDSCKKHSVDVPMTLTIDLPSKSIFNIANEEFDDGGNKFIDYIVSGMDVQIIIDSLKKALKKAYGNVEQQDSEIQQSM